MVQACREAKNRYATKVAPREKARKVRSFLQGEFGTRRGGGCKKNLMSLEGIGNKTCPWHWGRSFCRKRVVIAKKEPKVEDGGGGE